MHRPLLFGLLLLNILFFPFVWAAWGFGWFITSVLVYLVVETIYALKFWDHISDPDFLIFLRHATNVVGAIACAIAFPGTVLPVLCVVVVVISVIFTFA
jgi:hypothetical protein